MKPNKHGQRELSCLHLTYKKTKGSVNIVHAVDTNVSINSSETFIHSLIIWFLSLDTGCVLFFFYLSFREASPSHFNITPQSFQSAHLPTTLVLLHIGEFWFNLVLCKWFQSCVNNCSDYTCQTLLYIAWIILTWQGLVLLHIDFNLTKPRGERAPQRRVSFGGGNQKKKSAAKNPRTPPAAFFWVSQEPGGVATHP